MIPEKEAVMMYDLFSPDRNTAPEEPEQFQKKKSDSLIADLEKADQMPRKTPLLLSLTSLPFFFPPHTPLIIYLLLYTLITTP